MWKRATLLALLVPVSSLHVSPDAPQRSCGAASLQRRLFLGGAAPAVVALSSPFVRPVAANAAELTSGPALLASAARFEASVQGIIARDPAAAGTLLRLAFHDAITRDAGQGGANGSIRLEAELARRENRGLRDRGLALLRPLVEAAGDGVSSVRRGGLSWADAIALAGAVAVSASGGPSIQLELGRVDSDEPDPEFVKPNLKLGRPAIKGAPDSRISDRSAVITTLPSAGLDSDGLDNFFGRRFGFSREEIVALCGAHTLGRHASLLGVSKECLKAPRLTDECIESGKRLPFVANADRFDNSYFQKLIEWDARTLEPGTAYFIPTDAVLVVVPAFRKFVERFARDEPYFFEVFSRAYRKLSSFGFKGAPSERRRGPVLYSPHPPPFPAPET